MAEEEEKEAEEEADEEEEEEEEEAEDTPSCAYSDLNSPSTSCVRAVGGALVDQGDSGGDFSDLEEEEKEEEEEGGEETVFLPGSRPLKGRGEEEEEE